MKRLLVLVTTLNGFILLSKLIDRQQGATFQRAAGMHGIPLDAAASICPDAAPNCIFPSYSVSLNRHFCPSARFALLG